MRIDDRQAGSLDQRRIAGDRLVDAKAKRRGPAAIAGKLGISRRTLGPPFLAVVLYKRGAPGKSWRPLSNVAWVSLKAR